MGTDADNTTEPAAPARRRGARRWRVAYLAALGVPALLAALLGALLLAASQGYLTRPVTRFISEKLGRELRADGGLRIGLGRVIHVSATGLRLANAAWATPVDMLRARRVDVEIDAGSLFRDTVIVRQLTADDVVLNLQRNDKGENNWSFRVHPKTARAVLPVVFETVSIPATHVSFAGPRLEHPLELSLASVAQRIGADGMLVLRAIGSANDSPLELRVNSGPLAALVAARNFSVKVRGQLGAIALGLDTHIDSLATPEDTELAFNLAAPQASYLASRLGLHDFGDGPVALAVAISRAPSGGGVAGRLTGQIGEFNVDARGSLAVKESVPAFNVQGRVTGPDLSRVGVLIGVRGLPAESFRVQLDVQRDGARLAVREAALELAEASLEAGGSLDPTRGMEGSELSFKLSATDVARLAQRFRVRVPLRGSLELHGMLRQPRARELHVDCRGTSSYGNFSVLGPIHTTAGGYGTRLAWTVAGTDLEPLATALKVPDPPRGQFNGKGEIEWTAQGLLLRGVKIDAGGESASISGKLGRPAFGRGADLQLDVSGPNAARMAGRFGYAGLPTGRYRVSGGFQRQADRIVLSSVDAQLAGARVQLGGTLGSAPEFSATNLAFTASGPALANYAGVLPNVALPRGPFRASGNVATAGGNLLRIGKLQLAVGNATATVAADIDLPFSRHSLRYGLEANVPEPAALLPDYALAGKVGNQVQLSASGAWAKGSWSVERLRLSSDRGLLSTQGPFVILPRLESKGTQAELRAPSLKALGAPFDRHWPDMPVELRAKVSRDEQALQLEALAGRLGGTAFSGRFDARVAQGKPDLDVELEIPQLDLDRLMAKPAATKGSGKRDDTRTAGKPADRKAGDTRGRLVPDSEVVMPELGLYTGRLAVRAGRLRAWGSELTDFELQGTLRDGRLHVDPLAATGPSGSVHLKGTLAAKGKGVSVQLAGSGSDLRLRPVPIAFGGPDASRFTANIDLQASGSRWPELAATLNGRVRLVGKGGQLKNSLVMASASGFVQQLLSGLNPMATRQPTTDVDCAVYLLRAKDGVVTTDPAIVMRTREVDIVSAGGADLRSEKIDLSFKIRARTGLGFGISQLVNPYLKVNGTLANPGVTLDPTGALVNGGAAVATAGLSVVATTLWDRFVHESDPCGAAVAESDKRAARQGADQTGR